MNRKVNTASIIGSVVKVRDDLNKSYYGRVVTPVDIVIVGNVSNEGTAELRAELKKAVSSK